MTLHRSAWAGTSWPSVDKPTDVELQEALYAYRRARSSKEDLEKEVDLHRAMERMDRHLDGGGRLSDKTKKGLQESHHKFKAVSTLLKEQEAISLKAIDDIATTMETIECWSSRSGDQDMLGKTRARYVALLRAQQDILERVSAAQRKPLVSRHKGLWSV